MKTVALHPSDYLPGPPETKDYGIGFIGCGGIVIGSHLPAYENFGYNVVAACAIGQGRSRVAQERFGVPQVTQRIDDIRENEEVQIIDLAVHAKRRLPIVERMALGRIRAGQPEHLRSLIKPA